MRAVKKEWLLGMLCVLSGVMLMVMHPVQAQAGQADRAAYRAVFDASYYSAAYPDVAAAYGNNADALLNHFISFGVKEGRNAPYGITALLKILATPFTGFLPMIGFSLYLHTGAPFNSAGHSCHGTFGTLGLIILYLLITSTSFCRRRGSFFYDDRIYSFAFKNARFFSMRPHRCATHSTDLPGSDGVWNT